MYPVHNLDESHFGTTVPEPCRLQVAFNNGKCFYSSVNQIALCKSIISFLILVKKRKKPIFIANI